MGDPGIEACGPETIEGAPGAEGQDAGHGASGPGLSQPVAGHPDPGEDPGIVGGEAVGPLELRKGLRHRSPHKPGLVIEGDPLQKMGPGQRGIPAKRPVDVFFGPLAKSHPPGKAPIEDELGVPLGPEHPDVGPFSFCLGKGPEKGLRPGKGGEPGGAPPRMVPKNPGKIEKAVGGLPGGARGRKKGGPRDRAGTERGGRKRGGDSQKKESRPQKGPPEPSASLFR